MSTFAVGCSAVTRSYAALTLAPISSSQRVRSHGTPWPHPMSNQALVFTSFMTTKSATRPAPCSPS
jgi:hypothetical protein